MPYSFFVPNKDIVRDEMSKRIIFEELMEGVGAIKEHREGKLTLQTHKLPALGHTKNDAQRSQSNGSKIKNRRLD
jgi:hypothetical protein